MDILQGKAVATLPGLRWHHTYIISDQTNKHNYITIICKVITNDSSTQSLAIDPPMHYNTNQ